MYKQPFTVLSSNGLGTSYSSLTHIGVGELMPSSGFGQGNIQVAANVVTGNAVVHDHLFTVQDKTGPLQLGFIYNVLGDAPHWRMSVPSIPSYPSSGSEPLTRIEADGHVTTYTYDSSRDVWVAPAGMSSRAEIKALGDSNWQCYYPETGITELFDDAGQMVSRTDAAGHTVTFAYQGGELNAVTTSTGNVFEYRRIGTDLELWVDGTVERTYQFDESNRLSKTTIGDYSIEYAYDPSFDRLTGITQSDGSIMTLNFAPDGAREVLSSIRVGTGSNLTRFTYSAGSTVVQDAANQQTTVAFDAKGRVTTLSQPAGVMGEFLDPDVTSFSYEPDYGQVSRKTLPSGGTVGYHYQTATGQLYTVLGADGQSDALTHDPVTGDLLVRTRMYQDSSGLTQNQITRFVYDNDFNGHRVLRFELSDTGNVIEHRYDSHGDRINTRCYTAACFDVASVGPNASPSLSEMTSWVDKQDASAVTLHAFTYDAYGSVLTDTHYTTIDATGNGVQTDDTMLTTYIRDRWGNWLTKDVTQQGSVISHEAQVFDALNRLVSHTDAMGNTTHHSYSYADKTQIVTYPNGRTHTVHYDDGAAVSGITDAVATTARATSYLCNGLSLPIVITHPDGQHSFQFFDEQHRLAFTVSAEGSVVRFDHNSRTNVTTTTHYATQVDVAELTRFPGVAPDTSVLLGLLSPSNDDRASYQVFDDSHRLVLSIKPDLSCESYTYDERNLRIGTCQHNTKIAAADLAAVLKREQTPPTGDGDRNTRIFFDDAGRKVGKQDGAGYLTEYKLDSAGRVTEEIQYHTATPLSFDLDTARPAATENDGHIYRYWNGANHCVASIDQEKFITVNTYLASGKVSTKTTYANAVSGDPATEPDYTKLIPAANSEDLLITYDYDAANRVIGVHRSDGVLSTTAFDNMGDVTSSSKGYDSTSHVPASCSNTRTTTTAYDAWQQNTQEWTPLADPTNPDDAIRSSFDDTGLRVTVTDQLGHKSWRYYDNERRLRYSIDAVGVVTQFTYNAFSEVTEHRVIMKPLPADRLPPLTGGFVTPAVDALIAEVRSDTADAITTTTYTKNGQELVVTDPEKYTTTKAYNGCGDVETEVKQVSSRVSRKTVTEYDARGLEAVVTVSGGSGSAAISNVTRYQHAHPLRKITQIEDAAGGLTQLELDKRGDATEMMDATGDSTHYTRDAFARVVSTIDPEGNKTDTIYTQATRTKQEQRFAKGDDTPLRTTSEVTDTLGNVINTVDGAGNHTSTTHNALGSVLTHTDRLDRTTTNTYSVKNELLKTTKPDTVTTTTHGYDAVSNCTSTVNSKGSFSATDTKTFGALRIADTETDPLGVVHTQTTDRRGLLATRTSDPSGLAVQTAFKHNGLKQQSLLRQQKMNGRAVYSKASTVDAIGRSNGEVLDPTTLALKTTQTLDGVGKIVAEKDADGNVTHHVFDTDHLERYTIDPMGGVTAFTYTRDHRVATKRTCINRIDPSKVTTSSTPQDVAALIESNDNDIIDYHFYDALGQEVFTINTLGAVTETGYSAAGFNVLTTHYSTCVDPSTLASATTATITAAVKANANAQDRTIYAIRDAEGQERFSISPTGVITEKRYDSLGRMTFEATYSTPVADPASIAALAPDAVDAHITLDPTSDRYTYHYFGDNGMPEFTVNAVGLVTRYQYDANKNRTETVEFATAVDMPSDYATLLTQIKTFTPEPTKDRIDTWTFDTLNRQSSHTNAEGHTEHWEYNEYGNELTHIDFNGNAWTTDYDGAGRETAANTPALEGLNHCEFDASTGKVVPVSQGSVTAVVVSGKTRDGRGNVTALSCSAKGLGDAHVTHTTFNPCGMHDSVSVVTSLDDPSKGSDFASLPVQQVTVTKRFVYNTQHKPLVEIDERGQPLYHLYDAAGNECYRVNAVGAIMGFERNAFGEVIKETKYANTCTLDLHDYLDKGMPLCELQANLRPSSLDEVSTFTFDTMGNKLTEAKAKRFYAIPTDTDLLTGTASPITTFVYNSFNEEIARQELENPADHSVAQRLTLRNRTGAVFAEVDERNYATVHTLDVFGQSLARDEYAVALNTTPATDITWAELNEQLSSKTAGRRQFTQSHNLCGTLVAKTQLNCTVQERAIGPDNTPDFQDADPQDLTTRYVVDALQKQIGIIHPDGSSELMYRNARSDVIARVGVPRITTYNSSDTLRPLSYHYFEAFGKECVKVAFASGTHATSVATFPAPIKADAAVDPLTLTAFDLRGLKQVEQDPEGSLKGWCYDACKREARRFNQLTAAGPMGFPIIEIHGHRFERDDLGRQTLERVYVNNVLQSHLTQSLRYGPWHLTGEGEGTDLWPQEQRYDNTGCMWFRNHDDTGAPEILLHNLRGRVSVRIQSPVVDVSTKSLADLPDLAAEFKTPGTYETTLTVRDRANNPVNTILPVYMGDDTTKPANLPLCVSTVTDADGKVYLQWKRLSEAHCSAPSIEVWPVAAPDSKSTLLVTEDSTGTYQRVEVTSLVSDQYGYQLDYYFDAPITSTAAHLPKYRANGVVNVVTNNTEEGLILVAEADPSGDKVWFYGANKNLTAMGAWDESGKTTYTLTLKTDPVSHQVYADTSTLPAGVYTFKGITGPGGSTPQQHFSLPVSVYTTVAPTFPLTRTIRATNEFQWLDNHAEVSFTVDVGLQTAPFSVSVTYEATDGKSYTDTATLTPGKVIEHYTDADGKVLACNWQLSATPVRLFAYSLSVNVHDVDVPMVNWSLLPPATPVSEVTDALGTLDLIATHDFGEVAVAYLQNVSSVDADGVVELLDWTRDLSGAWHEASVTVCPGSSGVYNGAINVTALLEGAYQLRFSDKTDVVYQLDNTAANVPVSLSKPIPPPGKVLVRRSNQCVYSRWNKITRRVDPAGNVTDYVHNERNLCVQRTLPAVIVFVDFKPVSARPVTQNAFDIWGREFASRNPNGDVTLQVKNAAGNVMQHILGDGTETDQNTVDIFGHRTARLAPNGFTWRFAWNRRGHMSSQTSPKGFVTHYFSNEYGQRTVLTTPLGNVYCTNYDPMKHVRGMSLPEGESRSEQRTRRNQLLQRRDPDGVLTYHRLPVVGVEIGKEDLGGATYHRTLDHKNQVTEIVSTGGDHGQTKYCDIGKWAFKEATTTPNQHLQFVWRVGVQVEIIDLTNNTRQINGVDMLAHRTSLQFYQGTTLVQNIASEHNALGWMSWTHDGNMLLALGFDAAGNKVLANAKVTIQDFVVTGTTMPNGQPTIKPSGMITLTQSLGSTFDRAGRVLLFEGVMVDGKPQLAPGQGMSMTYIDNVRSSMIRLDPKTKKQAGQVLMWDEDQRYTGSNTGEEIYDRRIKIDADGRTTQWSTRTLKNSATGITTYDHNSRVTHTDTTQTVLSTKAQHRIITDTSGFSFEGIGRTYYVNYYSESGNPTDNLTATLVGFDTLQLASLGGTRTADHCNPGDFAAMHRYRDSNGVLAAIDGIQYVNKSSNAAAGAGAGAGAGSELALDDDPPPKSTVVKQPLGTMSYYFVNNGDGKAVSKVAHVYYASRTYPIFRGNYLRDASSDLLAHSTAGFKYLSVKDWWDGKAYQSLHKDPKTGAEYVTVVDAVENHTIAATLHLDISGIQPTDGSYPPPAPQMYTVMPGDDFGEIASKLWGSPELATQLADQQGFTPDEQLMPGQPIMVQPIVSNTDSARDTDPYSNVMRIIQGTGLYPHLNEPDANSMGFWGGLLDIVTSVTLSIVLPIVFGPLGEGVADVLTAAVDDMVNQGFAIAYNMQDGVNGDELAITVLESIVTVYIHHRFHNFPKAGFMEKMMIYTGINFEEQMLELELGLRKTLNFNEMVAQGISNTVSSMPEVQGLSRYTREGLETVTDAMVDTMVLGDSVSLMSMMNDFSQHWAQDEVSEMRQRQHRLQRQEYNAFAASVEAAGVNPYGIGYASTIARTGPTQQRNTGNSPSHKALQHAQALWMLGVATRTLPGIGFSVQAAAQQAEAAALQQAMSVQHQVHHVSLMHRIMNEMLHPLELSAAVARDTVNTVRSTPNMVRQMVTPYESLAGMKAELHFMHALLYGNTVGQMQRGGEEIMSPSSTMWQRAQGFGLIAMGLANLDGMSGVMHAVGSGAEAGADFIGRVSSRALSRGRVGLMADAAIEFPGAASHPLEGWTKDQVLQHALNLGVDTPRDQLILWSGFGKDGIKVSQSFAESHGGVTLEMTRGGQWLDDMNLFSSNSPLDPQAAIEVWAQLSKSLVQNASGQVRAVLGHVNPYGIYKSQELLELVDNPNVLGFEEIHIEPEYGFMVRP